MNGQRRLLLLGACALAAASPACRTSAPLPAPDGAPPALPTFDASALDRTVSPCDDFYRFACGGWIAANPIPADKARWGRFDELRKRNAADLRAILESDAVGRIDPADRYPRKVGDFYAACMDEPGIESRGLGDLRAQWAALDAVGDARSLAAQVARFHREGVPALFAFGSDQDFRDSTQVIGEVAQGGLTLPDRDYYLKDDPKTASIRAAYDAYQKKALHLAGVPLPEAEKEARAIQDLERSLAESHWTRVEMRDPVRLYNRVELAGLEKAAPRFPWKAYLAEVGRPGLTAINATTPRFLERIDALVAGTPPAAWRAYLRWQLLDDMAAARALPRAFVDARFAFQSASFTGAKELEPRWEHCVRLTDRALGEALGQAYVRRHFGGDAKDRTRRLVAEIEEVMGDDLRGLGWMDDSTRAQALEKLGRIFNKIGYPDAWRSYESVEVTRASLLVSLLSARAFEVRRDLDKIGKPVDRAEWRMTPPTVNAYYSALLNEIVFPAGILQPPFYGRTAPEPMNYGAVGMVVGHELTHGFDDAGRQFDARGNLRDWWSPAVGKEFERRAQCVVDQFAGYVAVDDVKVNGKLTLGENIADLGGVKLAFAAYRAAAGRAPAVGGFAPDQQFFLGEAQVWCSATRPEQSRLWAAIDPHAPPEHRVNGPLSNLPEFAAAFECPAGSRMVRPPEQRCEVW
jgi:endothelin-converting enzyme/putative endopeptidase